MGATRDTKLDVPVDQIQAVLDRYPVRLALVFGSHARQEASERSDVDIAVEFEDVLPEGTQYSELLLDLGADLEIALSESVDVVDLHRADPSLGRQILEDGVLLVGSLDRRDELVGIFEERDTGTDPPLERFDEALDRLDEHLT